jgi:hypothetical protein
VTCRKGCFGDVASKAIAAARYQPDFLHRSFPPVYRMNE